MNILHVTPYFAPAWAYGGPPRSVFELCRQLSRRGHAITVLTTDAHNGLRRASPAVENLSGIEVYRLPNLSNRLAWRRQLFLPRGTGRFLTDRLPRFDMVHMHMYRNLQNIAVYRHTRRSATPYVFSARGSLPRIVRGIAAKAIFDVAIGARVLRDAARCVASANAERMQYEAMGVPQDRIRTVYNGIDSKAYENLPAKGLFSERFGLTGRRIVAYVGRLNARKGLNYLLRAFRDVATSDRDAALAIVGPDDGYRGTLEHLARTLHLDDRVVFTGFLDGNERLSAFVDADVIVYPAKHEIFGLVPFEALACGKPVIVANDSGCGELIQEAGAGIVVPVENISRLADAISTSLRGGPEVSRMVERGQQFVAYHLNWDVICTRTEKVYLEAIEGRRPMPGAIGQ